MNSSAQEDPHDRQNRHMAVTNQESIKKIAVVLKEHDQARRALEEKVNGLMRTISVLQNQLLNTQQQVGQLQAKVYTGSTSE